MHYPTYSDCKDAERNILHSQLIQVSDPGVSFSTISLRRLWIGSGGQDSKYLMIKLFFDDAFSAQEIERLTSCFGKFLEILKGYDGSRNLWAKSPYSFDNVIKSPTKLLDRSRQYLRFCHMSLWSLDPNWNESTLLYIFFIGMLANCLPGADDSFCPAQSRYFPIQLTRYTQEKDPTGSWQFARSPVYDYFVSTKNMRIEVNAAALAQAGASDRRWAAVIFHEMMHNVGWDHPAGYDDRSQYILAAEDAFYNCGKD